MMNFRTGPRGLPILSAGQIDIMAESLLHKIQPGLFNDPVDAVNLDGLLKSLGDWHYAGRYLSKDGCLLGLAVFEAGRLTVTDEHRLSGTVMEVPAHMILVDRGLYDRKKQGIFRFTLAHEIGHAIFHEKFCRSRENMKNYAEQGRERWLADREQSFGIRERRSLRTEYDWVEWQANAFASAVLMPASLVRRTAKLVLGPGRPDAGSMTELCLTMADVFRVSETAAFYRMKEQKIVPEGSRRLANGAVVSGDELRI